MEVPATSEHDAALGRRVRDLRRSRGETLRDVAARIGVSPATLSAIENGKTGVSSRRLGELAGALGATSAHLLGETPAPTPPVAATPPAATPPPSPSPPPVARPETYADGGWRTFRPLALDPALAGALSSFLEFGYHGATMRTVAERAHLSVPGLYHHYASKHEMLVALLGLTMADLRARTEAALDQAGDHAVVRFAHVVECLALFHTHRRELGFVGASEMRSLGPDARARVAALRVEEQRVVDREVERGVATGAFATPRPHEAARAVVTMCTALAQWYRHDGAATAETIAAQYVDFALDLVRCRPELR